MNITEDNHILSQLSAFNQAMDCLKMDDEMLKKGILTALDLQKLIVRKASILLEGDDVIIRLGKLYYCCIHQTNSMNILSNETTNTLLSSISNTSISNTNTNTNQSVNAVEFDEPFARPQVLHRLGLYIMDIKRNLPKHEGCWSGKSLLPLIMLSQKRDTYIVVGISPLDSIYIPSEIPIEQKVSFNYIHTSS